MLSINNLLAICVIFLGGATFYFIFGSMIKELIKDNILNKKDAIFVSIMIILVFVIYLFLEKLHH